MELQTVSTLAPNGVLTRSTPLFPTQSVHSTPLPLRGKKECPSYCGAIGTNALLVDDPTSDTANPGDVWRSVIFLACTSLSAGALVVPSVLKDAGLIPGCVILVMGAAAAFVSMSVLMKTTAATGLNSYGVLVARGFGRRLGFAFEILLFLYGHGIIVINLIFLGDILTDFCAVRGNERIRGVLLLIALLGLVPLSLRDSQRYRWSPLVVVVLTFTAVAVVAHCVSDGTSPVRYVELNRGVLYSFPLCIFAYSCHLHVVPIASELDNATSHRVNKVCAGTSSLQLVFYLIMAIGGYLAFGEDTRINIMENYSWHGVPLITFSRILLSISFFFSIPANLSLTVKSFLTIMRIPPHADDIKRIRNAAVAIMLLFDVSMAILFKADRGIAFLGSTLGALIALTTPACIQLRLVGAVTLRERIVVGYLAGCSVLAFISIFV